MESQTITVTVAGTDYTATNPGGRGRGNTWTVDGLDPRQSASHAIPAAIAHGGCSRVVRRTLSLVSSSVLAWSYTPGWGNLFTVIVASIAIISSVVVSRITLRRNASQFEHSRLDARNDKLRVEVIDLVSALSARTSQGEILVQRIKELELEKVDLQTIHQNIKAIFSETLWDPHRRATSHAFAVLMLTEDKDATEAIGVILGALGKQRKLFEDAANPTTTFTVNGAEVENLSRTIDAAAERLRTYAILKLGVTAQDAHGHTVNKLNLLPPGKPA
jgi:hypothetical protein